MFRKGLILLFLASLTSAAIATQSQIAPTFPARKLLTTSKVEQLVLELQNLKSTPSKGWMNFLIEAAKCYHEPKIKALLLNYLCDPDVNFDAEVAVRSSAGAKDDLDQLIVDPRPEVRLVGADMLYYTKFEKWPRGARTLIEDSSSEIRTSIAFTLGDRGFADRISILISYLKDESGNVRHAALLSLNQLRRLTNASLSSLLRDPDTSLRYSACKIALHRPSMNRRSLVLALVYAIDAPNAWQPGELLQQLACLDAKAAREVAKRHIYAKKRSLRGEARRVLRMRWVTLASDTEPSQDEGILE